MVLQALLVSEDDNAAATLVPVLSEFGLAVQCCGYPNGVFCLPEYKLDALIVDFDDPQQAISIVQTVGKDGSRAASVVVGLLKDKSLVRNILSAGANFVLYKPVSENQAQATLRAAIALMKRERRRCFRVPLQVPVQLQLEHGAEREGIVLDLSEDGIDVLAAEPVSASTNLHARFALPDGSADFELRGEIAWANPNGQFGMRFVQLPEGVHTQLRKWVDSHARGFATEDLWVSECRLSDLSLGGCYVETKSPYPERSLVQLSLKVSGTLVNAEGIVQVMHPGIGMGIEFASRTSAQRDGVQTLLSLLTSCPGTLPELQITPRALIAGDQHKNGTPTAEKVDDPLLQLLWNHESLNQEEFLHELRQQRTTQ
jgi:FixJ family two-component response regulator